MKFTAEEILENIKKIRFSQWLVLFNFQTVKTKIKLKPEKCPNEEKCSMAK